LLPRFRAAEWVGSGLCEPSSPRTIGGQRQASASARALEAGASIQLFDEHFGALDPRNCLGMQNEFLRLRVSTRVTSIFVTHEVREAMRLATRIRYCTSGQTRFLGRTSDFTTAPIPKPKLSRGLDVPTYCRTSRRKAVPLIGEHIIPS